MRFLIALLAIFAVAAPAWADELRPAYVELTQQDETNWELLWKASAQSRLGATGEAIVPENCSVQGEPRKAFCQHQYSHHNQSDVQRPAGRSANRAQGAGTILDRCAGADCSSG